MNCSEVNKLLSQYLDGDLSPRQASDVRTHLDSCRQCCEAYDLMTAMVSTLDSEPRDTAQVDLFDKFQSYKQSHRGPKQRFIVPMMPRKWSTAAIAAALLIGATFAGTSLRNSRTLYVSNPYSRSTDYYSSMAIAADSIQKAADSDSVLQSDKRLHALIDVRAHGETLTQVIATLSKSSKVSMTVSPELASQRIYLRLEGVPISDVMAEIRDLLSSDWVPSETPTGRSYTLVCSPRIRELASAVGEAQAMAEAIKTLRILKDAMENRKPSVLKDMPIGRANGLGDELVKMAEDPNYTVNHDAASFFLIDDEVISTLAAGQEYSKCYDELSPERQEYYRLYAWTHHGYGPKPAVLRIFLNRTDGGTVMFNVFSENGGCGFGVFSLSEGNRSSNSLRDNDIADVLDEARQSSKDYNASWLQTKMGNVTSDRRPTTRSTPCYTVLEMLDLISDRTNLRIVADIYTIQQNSNRMFSRELTLGELLAVLDRDYGMDWSISRTGTLRLVHRQWPLLRTSEPPSELTNEICNTLSQGKRLSLDQLSRLAALPQLQFDACVTEIKDDNQRQLVSQTVNNLREVLRFYGQLDPSKRKLAASKAGLSSALLSDSQKSAAYSISGETPVDTTERPFVFSITQLRANARQIEKLIGKPISENGVPYDFAQLTGSGGRTCGSSGDPSAPTMDTPADYLILEFKGVYNVITVQRLPESN